MVCNNATKPKPIFKRRTPSKLLKSNRIEKKIIADKFIPINTKGDKVQPLQLYIENAVADSKLIQLPIIVKRSS